jgi:hypothetical protein
MVMEQANVINRRVMYQEGISWQAKHRLLKV